MITTGTARAATSVPAQWATAAWAGISLALFLAASLAIFAVNLIVRAFVDVPHLVEMAEWSVVWGLCSLLGVLIAARLAFGRWLQVSPTALMLPIAGIGLSATVSVVLQQWAIQRFGLMDADYIGWTAGLFAVLIGLATATFGLWIAPPGATAWPLAFVLLGTIATAFIVLLNLPGLGDGIQPESWPLAIWVGASGVYAVVVTLASVMRVRGPRH